jgi:hypothetical protein
MNAGNKIASSIDMSVNDITRDDVASINDSAHSTFRPKPIDFKNATVPLG